MRSDSPRGRWLAIFVVALMPGCAPTQEPRIAALYQGQAIVTGQDERSRPRGFIEAFEDVLVKVSGDQRLIGDPLVAPIAVQAASAVTEFSYRDRMEGIPIHDEQGTRDRPYDLSVRFDPVRVEQALRTLGRTAWLAPRPRLGVFVGVQIGVTRYVLARDGVRGFDQRNALRDAGARRGLPIILPSQDELAAAALHFDAIGPRDEAGLDAQARSVGADQALSGRMVWDPSNPGWVAEWRFMADGKAYAWAARDATFDACFRRAIGSAAQILSGNGVPPPREPG